MMILQISITFLNGTFHGEVDGGREEWPPSPMRVFQALVATAGRIYGDAIPERIANSLQWFSELPAPDIQSPPHRRAMPVQSSVPNNAMDICARAWSRGSYDAKDAKPSTHKAMKKIAPVRILSRDPLDAPIQYRWSVSDGDKSVSGCKIISALASRLVCIGWGLDLVTGHGELIDLSTAKNETTLEAIQWTAGEGGSSLRVPNKYSLPALQKRHNRFVNRIAGGSLASVPAIPPAAFDTARYGRAWETQKVSFAAFSVIEVDGSRFVRFPARKGTELVGMVRAAVASAARLAGWSEKKIAAIVLGHGERKGEQHQSVGLRRFAFVPLPSLESRRSGAAADHVGFIRRVLIYSPSGMLTGEVDWARHALSGTILITEHGKESVAMLSSIPATDKMVGRYIGVSSQNGSGSTWSTITPVVLPRNYMRRQDVRKLKSETDATAKRMLYEQRDQRIDALIRLAITQAGYSQTLARYAAIEWRTVGYWPGVPDNKRIFVPDHLRKFPTLHVRITWRDPDGNSVSLPGPIVLGGGRFYGLGLFAHESIQY